MDDALTRAIEELVASEGDPHPDVLDSILRHGDSAVEPLRALLRKANQSVEGVDYDYLVIGLLGELKAQEAVDELVENIRSGDEDALEWTEMALRDLDPVPEAPLQSILRDPSLNWYRRTIAFHLYERLAKREPAAADRLRQIIVEVLEASLEEDAEQDEMLVYLTDDLAWNLLDRDLPEDRPLLRRVMEAKLAPDTREESKARAKAAQSKGKRPVVAAQEEDDTDAEDDEGASFAEWYRHRYESDKREAQARQARQARQALAGSRQRPEEDEDERVVGDSPEADETEFVPSPRRGLPVHVEKVGRNEPCPCGSGKKYKKCCLNRRAVSSAGTGTSR